jgi:hypothetical protein
MYNLPSDFEPAIFVGKTLERVWISRYQARLIFDQRVAIDIFSEIAHRSGGVTWTWRERDSSLAAESPLSELVGHRVQSARVAGLNDLVLAFDTGDEVVIRSDSEEYECYHLHFDDREVIV